MGCPNVIVVTDHESVMGVFVDRDFTKMHNPFKPIKLLLKIDLELYPSFRVRLGKYMLEIGHSYFGSVS